MGAARAIYMRNICLILMVWTLFLYGWDDTADMEQGGYEESKKSRTTMLPKGAMQRVEAIEISGISVNWPHYPHQFRCNRKALGTIPAN